MLTQSLIYCSYTGKHLRGKTFTLFHLTMNIFLRIMSLSSNVTIQRRYSKSFDMNSYFPLKMWKFSPVDLFPYTVYVTQHEKIGLMCTKYTPSDYSNYLIFCTIYKRSVKCLNSPLFAALRAKVSLICYVESRSYETSNSKKVVKFYVHVSPIFSCRVTYIQVVIDSYDVVTLLLTAI